MPNENYIVRKLKSKKKTKSLHCIRLGKYEPNTDLQAIRPEGNLEPDKIIIPQDKIYVITWETNLGDFPNSDRDVTIPTRLDSTDISINSDDYTNLPGEDFTDVDIQSTGPDQNENIDQNAKTPLERVYDQVDDQQSSGGSETIVPEVSKDENDDMVVENESPRGVKYNFRPNFTPNYSDEYRY